MAVIATLTEPNRVTRVFFDCRNAATAASDQRQIQRAVEHSIALAQADEDVLETFSIAA